MLATFAGVRVDLVRADETRARGRLWGTRQRQYGEQENERSQNRHEDRAHAGRVAH